ncbi:MAG: response regulator [Pseudomonadota bacterium]
MAVNEKENAELNAFYRQFFDEAPDMFASVDPVSATVKYCNQTLCGRLGYSKAQVIGMPLSDLYHPDCHAEMARLFNHFVEHGHAQADRLKLITATGDTLHVSLRVSSHRNEAGEIVESRSIWRDVSSDLEVERLELELRLQEAQKMEGLALLAGGIAHDFNNMLVAMLGNASLVLSELPPESVVRAKIEAIETAAQRAADLTRQLLAYSGSLNQEQTHFDLSKVVEEMGHLMTVAISRKVVLNYDLAEEPVPVQGDITQVRQVIMNLLTNGSDAVGDRSGLVTIRTGLQYADEKYLRNTTLGADLEPGYYGFLEISDTGHGIAPDDLKRIFDPFFTTKAKGHGLGLAAVLGIVRSHNGALRVYSEPNNGTTVKILFPAQAYEPHGNALETAPSGSGRQQRVLVVDDEEHVLAVAAQMLEHSGFTFTMAADGREALEVYGRDPSRYAVVLMDITMPHMDGVAAFKALTELDPDCRVILMSGYSEQQATNSLTGRSFRGFIQKPFSQAALVNAVMDALREDA